MSGTGSRRGTAARKAIVSLGEGPQERLLKLAATTFRPYARRHGYDLHLRTASAETSRPAPWSKVLFLQELQEHYDVIVWLDADLMIVDGRLDLATELPADRFMGLVEHRKGDGTRVPNSGVVVLRTGDECRTFLQEVWDQDDLIEHPWWENAAIMRLLGYALDRPEPGPTTPWRERTAFLDPRWNAIHDAPAPRPYIRHYPGYKLRTRAAFMLRDRLVARP